MNTRSLLRFAAILLLADLLPAAWLQAEVVQASDGGFTSRIEIEVRRPPRESFQSLVDVASWWDSDHTFSGSSQNLSLEPRPNGCFCEKLPGGGGVRHAVVLYADPGRLLRMEGSLGPLQEHALTGILTFSIEGAPAGGRGSRVTLTYRVGGHFEGGLTRLAPIVDQVLAGQMKRLQSFIDDGRP